MASKTVVLHPQQYIDEAEGMRLRRIAIEILRQNCDAILLDLGEVRLIDAQGLGMLVSALKGARRLEKSICLCSVGMQPSTLLKLTFMDRTFQIFPSRSAYPGQIIGECTSESFSIETGRVDLGISSPRFLRDVYNKQLIAERYI